jgi:hypothetical protein
VVAQRVASFLDGATKSMDIATYDLRLEAAPASALLTSFDAAVKRGVTVRLMFNQDHALAIPVPAPPQIDWAFVDQLKSIGVQIKPISGVPDLMHHKYVVRRRDACGERADRFDQLDQRLVEPRRERHVHHRFERSRC